MHSNDNKVRYLIVGYARSGTTVTHLALLGHPNVSALNDELKTIFFTKGISAFTFGRDLEIEKSKGYSTLFDAITLLQEKDEILAHGAKIACNSAKTAQTVVTVLQKHMPDVKVIIIRRKDVIAQFGSGKIGLKTGIMHSWHKSKKSKKTNAIKTNKWLFIAYARNVNNLYTMFSKLKTTHDVLEINYEDLLESADAFYTRLFEFLHLPVLQPTWLKSKKVLPPPDEYIKNYSDLKILQDKIENKTLSRFSLLLSKSLNYAQWKITKLTQKLKKPTF